MYSSGKDRLILSNGNILYGRQIGAPIRTSGELVFTTAMVGYTEALTDPSYCGQILVFAFPLIGNYGVPGDPLPITVPIQRAFESDRIHASAVVLAVDPPSASHWSHQQTLTNWFKKNKIPCISGIDTRALIQNIRSGQLFARLEPEPAEGNTPFWRENSFFDPSAQNILDQVSIQERLVLGTGSPRIALIDCGVKRNIIQQLLSLGCSVELIPWNSDFTTISCDGWVISNGPGNPSRTGDLIDRVHHLMKSKQPILGICLGHQIMALAAGAKAQRLRYGHRSHNQPVLLNGSERAYLTSQNHGFVVIAESIPPDWEIWFTNLNDASVEGLKHRTKPFRTVQFHPEAAGGPRDTEWILSAFVEEVKHHASS